MKVMVIGGGGREHALTWKLSRSPLVDEIVCVPGNAGIARLARCIEGDVEDINFLADLALREEAGLTVVGPEAPLVLGICDLFREKGLLVLGPEREAAFLEGSKAWAKDFMMDCGIPTAQFQAFDSFEEARRYLHSVTGNVVIKADGLAAGKGVILPRSLREAEEALYRIMVAKIFGEAGAKVLLEEKLEGEEVSLLALTDGNVFLTMPSARDHKAVGEGDTGANTGGMGAYSPAHVLSPEMTRQVEEEVFGPVVQGMRKRGLQYRGIIYAGLMITPEGPKVLEFNVRLGDPEAQAILPRLESDPVPLLLEAARGELRSSWIWKDEAAVCVVLASSGYPGSYEKGKVITGLEALENEEDIVVFHAGTVFMDGKTVTAGGRVLGVTSWHRKLTEALNMVYRAVEKINFDGMYYRKDIACRSVER